jgi:hypothetical protein
MSITTDEAHDLLWGVPAIAAVINKPERSTYPLPERGDLPARKVRGRWVASRRKLLAALIGDEAASP